MSQIIPITCEIEAALRHILLVSTYGCLACNNNELRTDEVSHS